MHGSPSPVSPGAPPPQALARLRWSAAALLTFLGLLFVSPSRAEAPRKPNILLILVDDLGWKDVGYQGTDFYETPNIDALAREGMVFSQAYAAASVCAPSRACLLSGAYTPRHGVYAVGSSSRGPEKWMRLKPVKTRTGLPSSFLTLAEALRDGGYATGMFGKWHLQGKEGAAPTEQGFQEAALVRDSLEATEFAGGEGEGVAADPKDVFALTEAAGDFMAANRSRPFFCYLSHYSIHRPQQALAASLEHFRSKQPGALHRNALYAACLRDLDTSLGMLFKRLRQLGLEQDTLVLFTSDNGARDASPQAPLRGQKGSNYEGGIRVPLVVRWPGVVRAGSRSDIPTSNVDLYPTCLAAAGLSAPRDAVLDGESILPWLKGGTEARRSSLFWHFPVYIGDPAAAEGAHFRTQPLSVIRKGDWKLVLFHEAWLLDGGEAKLDSNHAVELYNLVEDPGEQHDVSVSRKDIRDRLLAELLGWIQETHAPMAARRGR